MLHKAINIKKIKINSFLPVFPIGFTDFLISNINHVSKKHLDTEVSHTSLKFNISSH